uniref:(northern house mosquito) hypothetical protein n=1 Tax=Culex pipiens TaxID=7175 RepID=A0A8D8K9N8_CULPI
MHFSLQLHFGWDGRRGVKLVLKNAQPSFLSGPSADGWSNFVRDNGRRCRGWYRSKSRQLYRRRNLINGSWIYRWMPRQSRDCSTLSSRYTLAYRCSSCKEQNI